MSKLENDPDAVGYGNPPKHSQFKKGQSGNPKGRPKKKQTPNAVLLSLMAESVAEKNGKQVSALEALLIGIRNDAVKGDARSRALLVKMLEGAGADRDLDTPDHVFDPASDRALIEHYTSRLSREADDDNS